MKMFDQIWRRQNQTPVLLVSAALVAIIAVVDWLTRPYISLGFLYFFPMMLAARFLPRWAICLLALFCALLSERFSNLDPAAALFRTSFETIGLAGSGLYISELLRNRRLNVESQERWRGLVETSPAAIVTVDERGLIELANRAATDLLAPRNGELIGHPVAAFLPELHRALRLEEGPQFRASMLCQAHRDNEESFAAEVWFSTYRESELPKLAAIIADITENSAASLKAQDLLESPILTTREIEVLRLVLEGLTNKEIAFRLTVSESIIKNTMQQLFSKTDVRTRSQLVRIALERYRSLL